MTETSYLMDSPGTVVIVTGTLTRYPEWTQSVMQCQYPIKIEVSWGKGFNLAANLNRAIANGIGDWFWLMGDDHVFAPDLLMRLLAHNLDIVAPVCCLRSPPFSPIVYRSEAADHAFELWPASELPAHGVHPVVACSTAGMVIHRRVFNALTPPYFEVGQIRTDESGEDLWFCHKLAQVGLTPYVDFDLRIGHETPMVVWPAKNAAGQWGAFIDATCQIPETAAV